MLIEISIYLEISNFKYCNNPYSYFFLYYFIKINICKYANCMLGYGYEKPSIIQQKGVLPLLKGRDTIA